MAQIVENKYGKVKIKIVENFMTISEFGTIATHKNVPFFNLEDAEKIALITENRHIQIAFNQKNMSEAYLVVHKSSNEIALANVEILSFYSKLSPRDTIASMAKNFII